MPRSIAPVEHRTAASPPPARRAGIPVGRVFGFPLYLSWTVLLLAALVTLLYGQVASYAVGLGFVVLLLVSVLLHELGHAVVARRLGIGVRGITLEIFGGYTELAGDAPNPRGEALIALAGPAVSLVLGLAAAVGAVLLPTGTPLYQVVFLVALANIIVALFNMLPGLPLDGGRALRAVVWAGSGSQLRGTMVAARAGQVIGAGTGAGSLALYLAGGLSEFQLIFLLLVAFVLWQGATASVQAARVQQRLPMLDLDQLTRPLVRVPTGTPLAEAQRQAGLAGNPQAVLAVTDTGGAVIAVVNDQAVAAVPQERRPWIHVDAVARERAALRTMPAGLRGAQALTALRTHPAAEYLVTSGEDVVGVLRTRDVARLLNRGVRTQRGGVQR